MTSNGKDKQKKKVISLEDKMEENITYMVWALKGKLRIIKVKALILNSPVVKISKWDSRTLKMNLRSKKTSQCWKLAWIDYKID